MSKTFDPTKPVQTRSGLPARILCTDRAPPMTLDEVRPIVALIKEDSTEYTRVFRSDGKQYGYRDEPWDLVNTPEKHTIYVNVWRSKVMPEKFDVSGTRCKAKSDTEAATQNRWWELVSRFEREITEGEGIT